MPEKTSTESLAKVQKAQARSLVYAYLSRGLLYPEPGIGGTSHDADASLDAAIAVLDSPGLAEAAQLVRQAFSTCDVGKLAVRYETVVGLASGCLPYETEYDQAHIFQKSQQLADVVAFYHAFGLALAPGLKERADHIGVELEFMHVLTAKEAYGLLNRHNADNVALCQDAQRAFLTAHLVPWVPSFGHRLIAADSDGPLGALGRLLLVFLSAEVATFALSLGKPVDLFEGEEDLGAGCETCPLTIETGK